MAEAGSMRRATIVWGGLVAMAAVILTVAAVMPGPARHTVPEKSAHFESEEVHSSGAVRTGLQAVPYDAVAGTLIVHPRGWDDAAAADKGKDKPETTDAKAAMFYVADFIKRTSHP
jgi:hypothetical protein